MSGGPYANASSFMGMAIEATRGTAAATPTMFVPVKGPKIQPVLTTVDTDVLIGSMVPINDQLITARHDEYSFTTFAYVDTLPALMRALLGSADTIVGTASPYTHTMSLLNSASTDGNQPPSYTFWDYDGYKLRILAGGMVDELGFKFTATGLVEVTVKVVALPYTVADIGAVTTAFTTVEAAPAWSVVSSINSVTTTPIVEGTLSFKRGVKALHTLGATAPFRLFAGPLDCAGCNLTVINQADTEQLLALAGTAFPVSFTFSPPTSTGLSFKFQLSTVKASQTHQERGGDGMIITQMDLKPIANATDPTATSGGVSPVKFVAVTAQATTY